VVHAARLRDDLSRDDVDGGRRPPWRPRFPLVRCRARKLALAECIWKRRIAPQREVRRRASLCRPSGQDDRYRFGLGGQRRQTAACLLSESDR
jgi:hypothetical protein